MKTNRRNFLKSLGGLALFTIVPRPVLGKGFMAPSDQLTKGIIGVGGMGRGHVNYGGTRLVAICDVDRNHLEAGKNLVKESIATYHDFRESNTKLSLSFSLSILSSISDSSFILLFSLKL